MLEFAIAVFLLYRIRGKRRFEIFGLATCTNPGLFCSVVRKNRKIPDKQIQKEEIVHRQ